MKNVSTQQIDQEANAQKLRMRLTVYSSCIGGSFLIAGLLARWVFGTDSLMSTSPALPATLLQLIAAVILGLPLIWDAGTALFVRDRQNSNRVRSGHMDILIGLAYLAAMVAAARGDSNSGGQYWIAGVIALFMLLSSFLEDRSAVGAKQTIAKLLALTSSTAIVLSEDGTEVEIEATQLRPGQKIVIRPGEKVSADGTIIQGASTLSEAAITGESLPVEKKEGDEVYSGTLNNTSRLIVEVQKVGSDSTLGQVQEMILQASHSKPGVVRVLEQYATYYTPTVLCVAAMVFYFTERFSDVVALLLIACPSAIVLCAPSAMVASLSAAARLGVHIKGVSDLEEARRINAIVFDKTGTLTRGELTVEKIRPAANVKPVELLQSALTAENNSHHPVAKAVIAIGKKGKLQPEVIDDMEEVPGRGVRATVGDSVVLVGRLAYLEEHGIACADFDTDGFEGYSLLYVARDAQLLGVLALADEVRPTSAAVCEELEELGVTRRVMITGDRRGPADRVARLVKVTDYEAEALPGDKLELVEALQAEGYTVAVVGDGVNDGPALAAGNVSIAMGAAGSDVAIHSAGIALRNSNLNRIPFLMQLSRRTVMIVRQNLAMVMLYVLLMLGLLALRVPQLPVIAALALGLLDVAVIFNSARLIREGEDVSNEFDEQINRPGVANASEDSALNKKLVRVN